MKIQTIMNKAFFILIYSFFFSTFSLANNPPRVSYDVDTVDFNTTLTVSAPGLLANDSDIDGDTITIIQFFVEGTTYNAGDTAVIAGIGSITINADGSYTFIPVTGYDGTVPDIFYLVSDGTDTNTTVLYLTVEMSGSLLDVVDVTSCNQGYTSEGYYQIYYTIQIRNKSITRGYHDASNIEGIQIINDLNSVFGDCIFEIERRGIGASNVDDFLGGTYPSDWNILSWDDVEFNETDATPGAEGLLNTGSVATAKLYPRQSLYINFCVKIDPFCNGRPNPTPSGSGIDFNNIVTVTTTTDGNETGSLEITDFHTSDTTVSANLFVQEQSPLVNYDGTYDFTDTVIITNDGNTEAQNVNFNLGLGNFIDNGIVFSTLTITQVGSGPTVQVNTTYNGDTDTFILAPNQTLPAGETIYLQIYYIIEPISSTNNSNVFSQMNPSMTYGGLDGYDETTTANLRRLSFVTWSDSQGTHSDRYYISTTNVTDNPQDVGEVATSTNQCICSTIRKEFIYILNLSSTKTITNINTAPNGIPEHEEITFVIRGENLSSSNVRLENVTLTDDLNSICSGNILSVSTPVILGTSTAEQNPNINPLYNGTTDINIFDGTSGIINPNEFIEVEFTIIIANDCIGTNTSSFSGNDPLGTSNSSINASVNVLVFSDNDNDGITDVNDLDDDNDGIPDILEYNGLDPLADTDNDNIPNYRDTDFGADNNLDGIIDIFDFDLDGIPNHFDLDSDNDSIYDIIEAGNQIQDTDNNGMTNNPVGINGLDNILEDNDTGTATITYTIQNSDTDSNLNYLDIDSDNDGIVDAIEAQTTLSYINPTPLDANENGMLDVYENLESPTDTDGDNILDYIDNNSDNDFYSDLIEGWDTDNDGIANTNPTNIDSDNDGLDNAFDNDDTQINPTNGQVPTDFPNLDNASTIELDWREAIAITVTIQDVIELEGNTLQFTTTIDDLSPADIIIQITTTDNTATSPDDYTPPTGLTITIPAGQLTATTTVDIPSIQDDIYEGDETFNISGNVISNNTINNPTAIGTIIDDDPKPIITILDADAIEGDDLNFTITLTTQSSTPITIEFTTNNNTAIEGQDYIGVSSFEFIIPPLTMQTEFLITTINDLVYELTENMNLAGVVTSTNTQNTFLTNTGVIFDNEPIPIISINNPEVIEGNTLVFNISVDVLSFEDIDFNIFTSNGTAREPEDYTAISISTILPALTQNIQINVETIDDRLDEDIEDLTLTAITTSSNTQNLQVQGIGTIIDNDAPNLFSPNGDGMSDYFEIEGLESFPNFTLQIFDRYGSIIYNYANKGNPNPLWWNGTYKGNLAPEGVYYYILDYKNNSQKPIKGFIQLIR